MSGRERACYETRMKPSVRLCVAMCAIAAIAACKKGDPAPTAGSDPWSAKGSGSAASGDDEVPPAPLMPAIAEPLPKPFFFTATKGGHTIYLFGTIHIGAQPSAIPPWVLEHLDKSPVFAMEANIQDPAMLTASMRQDGKTLDQELGPEIWAKFQATVGKRTAENLKGMKVSAAATILEVRGMPMTMPLDLFFFNRAKDARKEIVFLEEGALQLALLDKWLDARTVKAMLDDPEGGKKATLTLMKSYATGDAEAAEKLAQDDSEFLKQGRTHDEFVQFTRELLLDRNASWIAKIDAMAAKGDGFVAVGAMHLIGPGSVPELLGKAGFTVTRVAAP